MLLTLVFGVTTALVQMAASSPYIAGQPKQETQFVYNTANLPNSYNFYYNADDGSSRTERGEILKPESGDAALDVLGSVRWYDSKGQLYEMTYKAGTRGYRTIIRKVS